MCFRQDEGCVRVVRVSIKGKDVDMNRRSEARFEDGSEIMHGIGASLARVRWMSWFSHDLEIIRLVVFEHSGREFTFKRNHAGAREYIHDVQGTGHG